MEKDVLEEMVELVGRGQHLNIKYGRLGPLRKESAVRRVLDEDAVLAQRMDELQEKVELLARREGEQRKGCPDCRVSLCNKQKR